MQVLFPVPSPLILRAEGQFEPSVGPLDHFAVVFGLPYWGILKSMRFGVERDGMVVFDIHHYDMGVTRKDGIIWLQLQFADRCVADVREHRYTVDVDCDFLAPVLETEPDIGWPSAEL